MGSVSSRLFAGYPDVEAESWCFEGFGRCPGKPKLGGDEQGSVLGRQVAAHSQKRASLGEAALSSPCFTAVQAPQPFLFHRLHRAQ